MKPHIRKMKKGGGYGLFRSKHASTYALPVTVDVSVVDVYKRAVDYLNSQ